MDIYLARSWPKYEDKYLYADTMNIAVQINGKTRGTKILDSNLDEIQVLKSIKSDKVFGKYLNNAQIKKEIYIPNRLVNFVIA